MTRLLLVPLALVVCLPLLRADALDDEPTRKELRAVTRGNNRFAVDLFAKLRAKEGNLFVSPFSISAALAMTSAGAKAKTLEEMQDALHLPEQKVLHPTLGWLIKKYNNQGKKAGYRLSVANALWGQKDHKFRDAFLKVNKDNYGAGLQTVDYKKDRDGAAKAINGWVEKQTDGKIKDLIKPTLLNANTRLVLTNAIYFQGDWLSQFKKDRTKDQAFHLADDKTVKVPLMLQIGKFGYTASGDMQVLELPYKGKELSMVVLLPKKKDGLDEIEKELTHDKLEKMTAALRPSQVQVYLPRFKIESSFALRDPLEALGMKRAFGPSADFSGMDGTKSLFITAVVHKAFVEVDEKGTKAAAATGVVVGKQSKPRLTVFRVDHPFVFLIRDVKSGAILFLGRLANPKS